MHPASSLNTSVLFITTAEQQSDLHADTDTCVVTASIESGGAVHEKRLNGD